MAEKLTLSDSNLALEYKCPKCGAKKCAFDAVGEAVIDYGDLRISIELRCVACHATIGELKLDGSAPEDEAGDDC